MGRRPAATGDSAPAGGWSSGMHPPFSFPSCGKENGLCTVQKKRPLRRAPARSCLRATGGGGSVQAPILACLRARYHLLRFLGLPSRGGWCGSCRDARTHLNCFSFPVSRYGAPGISVISVPLVPPSARSASLRTALAVIEAAAWPYAETLINHRPAAAKISAACIPDFPGLEGLPRAGRFPL